MNNNYLLKSWGNKDFEIKQEKNHFYLFRKINGSSKPRREKDSKSLNEYDVFKYLQKKYNIPLKNDDKEYFCGKDIASVLGYKYIFYCRIYCDIKGRYSETDFKYCSETFKLYDRKRIERHRKETERRNRTG
jgi:prophage antirepressor-like protein